MSLNDDAGDICYLRDAQIRRKLQISEERWPGILAAFELQGFPRPDPIVGKRFWPAVQKWLFDRHGIGVTMTASGDEEDGEEYWPHKQRQRRAR